MILPHSWCACRINRIFFCSCLCNQKLVCGPQKSPISAYWPKMSSLSFFPLISHGAGLHFISYTTLLAYSQSLSFTLSLSLSLSLSLIICTWPGSRIAYFWLSKLGHGYVTPNNPVPFTPKAFGLGKTSRIVYCLGFSFELSPSRWAAS